MNENILPSPAPNLTEINTWQPKNAQPEIGQISNTTTFRSSVPIPTFTKSSEPNESHNKRPRENDNTDFTCLERFSKVSRNSSQQRKQIVPSRNDSNAEGKSSLDLVVEWLKTGDNYNRWCDGSSSKKDIAQTVVQFLVSRGIQGRDARGVEQQIYRLEVKYRAAADWRAQTGRVIEKEIEAECARLSNASASNADTTVRLRRQARDRIEAELCKRCPYFFELDPVFSRRASPKPSYVRDQTNPETASGSAALFGLDIKHRSNPGTSTSATKSTTNKDECPPSPTNSTASTSSSKLMLQTRLTQYIDSENKRYQKQIGYKMEMQKREIEKLRLEIEQVKQTKMAYKMEMQKREMEKLHLEIEDMKQNKVAANYKLEMQKIQAEKLRLEIEKAQQDIKFQTIIMPRVEIFKDLLSKGYSKEDALEKSEILVEEAV